ncbi:MAG: hypothetical protein H6752_10185 [Candidatus Omnitrophica bacterium]|nr:hypothetical protein [Candidatus Omnitrophota bacterium]
MAFYRTTILLLALSLPAHAATLFVSPDGTGVDGLTWETAFPTIGEAIVASSTGDEVWIRSATYRRTWLFRNHLTILGGFDGTETLNQREQRDPETNETVVDGNQNGSSVIRYCLNQCGPGRIRNCELALYSGSGIHISDSSAT